jgi:hypothetical protein
VSAVSYFTLKILDTARSTLEGYSDVFRYLEKNICLGNPEAVKAFIASKK